MSKEISLFNTDELTFKEKFYNLMDLLITNQSVSMMEAILFLSIFYLQYISAFFDEKIEVFNGSSYFLVNILNHIKKNSAYKRLIQWSIRCISDFRNNIFCSYYNLYNSLFMCLFNIKKRLDL